VTLCGALVAQAANRWTLAVAISLPLLIPFDRARRRATRVAFEQAPWEAASLGAQGWRAMLWPVSRRAPISLRRCGRVERSGTDNTRRRRKVAYLLASGGGDYGRRPNRGGLVPLHSPGRPFVEENLARIIVFHLPCAFASTVFLIWGAYLAIGSLRAKTLAWDVRTAAAMELCLIMCILTMLTGILFSKTQWGAWWQNDPRQWSFLLVLLVVAAISP